MQKCVNQFLTAFIFNFKIAGGKVHFTCKSSSVGIRGIDLITVSAAILAGRQSGSK